MNELKTFLNDDFGAIRIIEIEGKEYFSGSDIAKCLGYAIPTKAVNTHCKGVSKMEVPTNGGKQEMIFIKEGDVYRLISRSKLPKAEEFEEWIFDIVLPSIRKNGGYVKEEREEDFINKMFPSLSEKTKIQMVKELQMSVKELQPKAENYDLLINSKGNQTIGQFSKTLGIGRNKMFEYLRNMKLLMKDNVPYQYYITGKYFITKEKEINGHNTTQTFITAKGIDYITNKLKEKSII